MTSIEWLISKLGISETTHKKLFEQAKEMHKQEIRDACGMALSKLLYQQAIEKQSSDELRKQEIIDAYEQGQKDTAMGFYIKSGETYYNNLKK
jgi:hypothetical protein